MIRLDTTTTILQAVLAGAVATTQPRATVFYSDDNGTTYPGAKQLTTLNGVTDVDICDAPAVGVVRDIDYLSIINADTAPISLTIKIDVGGVDSIIIQTVLQTLETIVYTHSNGWEVLAASGALKTTLTGSAQDSIQFQDEGANLGAAGTADIVNFTGPGIVASRVGNTVTVNAPNAGTGTVTSVGLTATPAGIFDVSNSPITTNGNINLSLDNQSANQVLAGPVSGAAAPPAFRPLIATDIPVLDGFRNKIIGGDFGTNPWQRGVSFTGVSASGTYTADRFTLDNSSSAIFTIAKDTSTNPTVAQAGRLITANLLMLVTTADAAIAAGDFCLETYKIEGYNFQSLAQRPMVFSFWHHASKIGTYCVTFRNSSSDRSFIAEYTQAVANTWEYTQIVIPPSPVAGTWNYTNGLGLQISFVLAAGTNFQTAPGIWQTGALFATVNQVNALDAINNTFRIAGIQLESGTVATPFESRSFGEELELCQRYYEKSFQLATVPIQNAGFNTGEFVFNAAKTGAVANTSPSVSFKTRKRSTPTLVSYNPVAANNQIFDANLGVGLIVNTNPGFETSHYYTYTGNAATVTGDDLRVHWTADAEL